MKEASENLAGIEQGRTTPAVGGQPEISGNRVATPPTCEVSPEAASSVEETSPAVASCPETPRAGTARELRPVFRPLPQYRVLLHNDDLVEMGYVVRSIVQLARLQPARAYVVMMTAHTRGVALITITHRERAELYQQQFCSKGLIVTIEAAE